MLVSPLMGPVMSITFGAIISDKELMVSAVSPYVSGFFRPTANCVAPRKSHSKPSTLWPAKRKAYIWTYMSVWKTTHTHTYTPNSEKWNSENSCQGDDAEGCGGGGRYCQKSISQRVKWNRQHSCPTRLFDWFYVVLLSDLWANDIWKIIKNCTENCYASTSSVVAFYVLYSSCQNSHAANRNMSGVSFFFFFGFLGYSSQMHSDIALMFCKFASLLW